MNGPLYIQYCICKLLQYCYYYLAHIFFDDAIEKKKKGDQYPDVNEYVKAFFGVINETGRYVMTIQIFIKLCLFLQTRVICKYKENSRTGKPVINNVTPRWCLTNNPREYHPSYTLQARTGYDILKGFAYHSLTTTTHPSPTW